MARLRGRLSLLPELGRILVVLPGVEVGRRCVGPKPLLAMLRRHGDRSRERDPQARVHLQQVIDWVDRRCPDGGNCYRRALLEVALDRTAAREPFQMGFRLSLPDAGGASPEPGHAWLGQRGGRPEDYDAVVVL
jgi:hypothetical protein